MMKKFLRPIGIIILLSCPLQGMTASGIALESEDVTLEDIITQPEPRGTQNWEESQKDFFIFPGIVLTLILLAYFFTRD